MSNKLGLYLAICVPLAVGCLGPPTIPDGELGTEVQDVDRAAIADALRDASWITSFPGSEVIFITWFTFGSSALDVAREARDWDGDATQIQWTDQGAWEVDVHGQVAFEWSEYRPWDDASSVYSNEWSYAVVDGPLKERMYPEVWNPELGDGPFWSGNALRAVGSEGTTFAGEWSSDAKHPDGYYTQSSRSVGLTFDAPPKEGEPCTMKLSLTASERSGGRDGVEPVDVDGAEAFEWSCQVSRGPDGLLTIELGDRWSADLWERDQPDEVLYAMWYGFAATLFLDPQDPSILGFRGVGPSAGAPLMALAEGGPPR